MFLCISCKWRDHVHCVRDRCECGCQNEPELETPAEKALERDELREFTEALLNFLSR